MKWYPSNFEVVKVDELKALSKGFIFVFEVGLRKIECSSIKIKSKERYSSTPRARRIFLVTVDVGSPDVSRNSWPSKVTTHAGSPDAQSLSLCSDCGRRKSRPKSSPNTWVFAGRLCAHVGSLDVRWNSRQYVRYDWTIHVLMNLHLICVLDLCLFNTQNIWSGMWDHVPN